MSAERRLRDELDRLAAEIDPDVERNLAASLDRVRARSRRGAIGTVLAFSAVVVAVMIIGPALIQVLRNGGASVGSGGSPIPAAPLRGVYTVTLASDDAAVREHAMNGEWTIGFGEDGILEVTAPADFSGTRTGYSFQLTDSQLRTDLFSADVCTGLLPGTYRWQVIDRSLTLTVDEDPCRGRVALLSGGRWRATDGGQ